MTPALRYFGIENGECFYARKGGFTFLGKYQWGNLDPSGAMLAKMILQSALQSDGRASKLYRRFFHRVIRSLPEKQPWTLSLDEVMHVVADIEQTEKDTAQDRAAMARELQPRMSDAPARDQGWSKNPEFIPNVKKER